MTFDLRPVKLADVAHLFRAHHGYASVGKLAAYAFAVFEERLASGSPDAKVDRVPVAAYAWQPPPPSAARSVFAELPHGVLALSRMVAVPRDQRVLKHVSKPLRVQAKTLIDRARWPVLVTYSDESQGHTGYVYQCAGWTPTTRRRVATFTIEPEPGSGDRPMRRSRYSNGGRANLDGAKRGFAWIQRWEHWQHGHDEAGRAQAIALFDARFERREVEGRRWRSGSQAYTYVAREAA